MKKSKERKIFCLLMKRKQTIIGMIITVILFFTLSADAEASGGGETEAGIFENFKDMDYALFLETNVGYGVTLNYYRYGIYGDFAYTAEDGEKVYFHLCKKLLGTELAMKSHEDWVNNKEFHIQNLSPDLHWVIAREYPQSLLSLSCYKDQVFFDGKLVAEGNGKGNFATEISLSFGKNEKGGYYLLDNSFQDKRAKIAKESGGYSYPAFVNSTTSIDKKGKLLAAVEAGYQTIRIYRLEDETVLHYITVEEIDTDWPIEISQIEGEEDNGWIVFSNGDVTYKMTYPDGKIEKIGEYMYGTVYSPDERYRAYCTGNIELSEAGYTISSEKYDEYCRLYERWDAIPAGWYIEEVETGEKAYIPIEVWAQDDRPLYGGRCIWLEKDKLLDIVNP